jgi:hypothetical protein
MGLNLPPFADAEEVAYALLSFVGTVVKGTPSNIVTPVISASISAAPIALPADDRECFCYRGNIA